MPALGFYNAPATKVVMLVVSGCSFFLNQQLSRPGRTELPFGVGRSWLRFLAGQFTFASPFEAVIGLILLYQFRVHERQMGSRKFSSLVALAVAVCSTLQLALLVSFPRLHYVRSGPYHVIFALFVHFFAYIPRLTPRLFTLMGVHFSEKSPTYVLGLQLLMSDGVHSVLAGVVGVLFGLIYSSEALVVHRARFPKAVADTVERFVLPLVASGAPGAAEERLRARERQRLQRQQQMMQQQQQMMAAMGGFGGAGAAQPGGVPAGMGPAQEPALPNPRVEPSEANIVALMGMGFERDQAANALATSGDNLEIAANRLLSG